MSRWTRTAPMVDSYAGLGISQEQWSYIPDNGSAYSFDIRVKTGKPFDVVKLKESSLEEVVEYSNRLNAIASQIYTDTATLNRLKSCPCCFTEVAEVGSYMQVFGVNYTRCRNCGHVFVAEQPDSAILESIFRNSETHSSTYVDKDAIEVRISEIIQPKLSWVLGEYEATYSRSPRSILDVGAGGGHFVEGARRRGISAEGIELSLESRNFAKEAFQINLWDQDFLDLALENELPDVITFWGLLEYIPNPISFLKAAHDQLSNQTGMLIVEVPRADAFGTASQQISKSCVSRHMDPTSHVNAFSDASLATVLVESGFRPVAAWYFGMDAYEALIQLGIRLGIENILDKTADIIPVWQKSLDFGRQCDDVVIAAIPV